MRDKFQVLVVNEDSTTAVAWQTALERAGYHVMRASHAAKAFERLEAAHIDAMIVEHQLSDMTGEGLTQKARERWPQLRVVLHAGTDSKQLGLRSDAKVVLLSKAPTAKTLKTRLERLLPEVAAAPVWQVRSAVKPTCGASAG